MKYVGEKMVFPDTSLGGKPSNIFNMKRPIWMKSWKINHMSDQDTTRDKGKLAFLK